MAMRKWIIFLILSSIFGVGGLDGYASPLTGITVVVNRTEDGSDLNPGDGVCDASVNVGVQCSLRAAIEELNAQGPALPPHRIEFAIPGTGPFTIAPGSALPAIDVPMEIDGETQPGASCPTGIDPANLMIVLDGTNAGANADGLIFPADNDHSTVRGLVIVNFDLGIEFIGNNHVLNCSHIGIGPDGASAMGNMDGVYVVGDGNSIGGLSSPDQQNVISGNDRGIVIHNAAILNNIAGNFVGLSADGLDPAGNSTGMEVFGSSNTILGNIISGNIDGLLIFGDNNIIKNNDIGLAGGGTAFLPNTGHGILMQADAIANEVGGPVAAANRIAFNGGDGIRIVDGPSDQNRIRRNAIFANGGLGIDLGGDGVTANDPGDGDTGANQRQNYPILESSAGSFIVEVTLDSLANTTFIIDVYRNESCDASGYGEGQQYLDTGEVTTDASGLADFEVDLSGMVSSGNGITATATDPDGNTSEFSNCVTTSPVTGVTVTVDRIGDGGDLNPGDGLCDASVNVGEQCSLRAAIQELNAQGPGVSPHRIEFKISGTGPYTITPGSPLPVITVPVEIDASTQPGSACPSNDTSANLMIVLDGKNAGVGATGLALEAGSAGSIIAGLVIGNFDWIGIGIASDGNKVRCSHVGIGRDGMTVMGNGEYGILVLSDDNVIGGENFVSRRNIISGNGSVGIHLNANASDNFIANNFIGTTAGGVSAAGNRDGGVFVSGSSNIIGGVDGTAGNLISGNEGDGIRINEGDLNLILGNSVGIARDGITALPNFGDGLEILVNAVHNVIGGFVVRSSEPGSPDLFNDITIPLRGSVNTNRIANNGGHGVVLKAGGGFVPIQTRIRENAIYDNAMLGIDLGNDGIDANDSGDGDGGPNEGQNYPLLASASASLVVTFTLESQINTEYTIDLYRSQACDPSGYGEGEQHLGEVQMITDGSGVAVFAVDLAGLISPGDAIAATATDSADNTSEFSNCVTVLPAEDEYPLFLPLIRR